MLFFLKRWLPAIVWAAFIFYLSSIPDLRSSLPDFWDLVLRKFAHAGEYALFSILIVRALPKDQYVFVVAFCIVVFFGVSDEIHQSFVPGRVGSPIDVAVDVMGGAAGLLFLYFKWLIKNKS